MECKRRVLQTQRSLPEDIHENYSPVIVSGIVSKTDVQQRHLQAVPPTYSFQSHLAYLSERMRKRRCFADKQLDTAMFPKETFPLGIYGRIKDGPKYRHCIGATEHEYQMHLLKKIFPNLNENVLELILRAHGCSLEKTIEHLVQTMSLGKNLTNGLPKMIHPPSNAYNKTLLEKGQSEKTELIGKVSAAILGTSDKLDPGEREKLDITKSSQSIKNDVRTSPTKNGTTLHSTTGKAERKSKDATCSSNESLPKTKKQLSVVTNSTNKKPLSFSIDAILS